MKGRARQHSVSVPLVAQARHGQSRLFQRSSTEILCSQHHAQRVDETCIRPPHALRSDRQWRVKLCSSDWVLVGSQPHTIVFHVLWPMRSQQGQGPAHTWLNNKVVCEVLSAHAHTAKSPPRSHHPWGQALATGQPQKWQCWQQDSNVAATRLSFATRVWHTLCPGVCRGLVQIKFCSRPPSIGARSWCEVVLTTADESNVDSATQILQGEKLTITMNDHHQDPRVDAPQKVEDQRVDHRRLSIAVETGLPKISRLSRTTGKVRAHGFNDNDNKYFSMGHGLAWESTLQNYYGSCFFWKPVCRLPLVFTRVRILISNHGFFRCIEIEEHARPWNWLRW